MTDFDPAAVALALVRQTIDELRFSHQQAIEDVAGEHLTAASAAAVRSHLRSWAIRLESVLPHRDGSTP